MGGFYKELKRPLSSLDFNRNLQPEKMKCVALAVILSLFVAANAKPQPVGLHDDVAAIFNDPSLLADVYRCVATQLNMRQPVVNKRNSELLNSLLGLPQNILRSGK